MIAPFGVPRVFPSGEHSDARADLSRSDVLAHEDGHGYLLEEAFPDAGSRMGGHAGNRPASPCNQGLVAYRHPSLLDLPGLAYHVEEAERNTTLGTPAAPWEAEKR